jgi:hypothetical protein
MNYEDAIKTLLDEELSYTEIARRLGISRNAVAGHIFRIRKAQGISTMRRKPLGIMKTARVTVAVTEIPNPAKGKHITELEDQDCRYPIDHIDGHHFFCGEPRRDPRTRYCAEHHPIVWHKVRKGEATPDVKKKSRFELKRLGN